MGPDLIAAWWGVAIAALVGVGGVVVGAIGLAQAKKAAVAAEEANSIARQANKHASHANQIAREANDLSKSTAARSDEQHDVAWEWGFDDQRDGFVWIQNIGQDQADEVTIQFRFRDLTEANPHPMTVVGREKVPFEIPGLAAVTDVERRRRTPRSRTTGTIGGPKVRLPGIPVPPRPEKCRVRVTWRTPLGTPKSYDSDWHEATLPE